MNTAQQMKPHPQVRLKQFVHIIVKIPNAFCVSGHVGPVLVFFFLNQGFCSKDISGILTTIAMLNFWNKRRDDVYLQDMLNFHWHLSF